MPRADGIVRIRVLGNDELAKAIKKVQRAVPDEAKKIGLDVADMVAAFARRKVPLGPARNGHVRTSLEGKVRRGLPVVDGGGPGFPYYGWLEFGGRVGINRSVWRDKEPDGRYIYPTVRERRAQVEDIMRDGIEGLMRRYGIGVR